MALSWEDFGYQSYIYLLSPAWHAQKKYNQTHNVDGGGQAVYAPLNYLNVADGVAQPGSQLFVTPNINVIYGSAHLDLSQGNVLVDTSANIDNRYCIWQLMDAFMNVFSYIGSTETVTDSTFHQVGGQFCFYYSESESAKAAVPEGYTAIPCPTQDVWVVTRYFVEPDHTDATVALMFDECPLGPQDDFPSHNKHWDLPLLMPKLNITKIASTLDAGLMYQVMNEWLGRNGWGPASSSFKQDMESFGLGPNLPTNWPQVMEDHGTAILKGIGAADKAIDAGPVEVTTPVGDWVYSIDKQMGDYGQDYLLRSVIARDGLGANRLSQCVYPACRRDQDKELLDAGSVYQLTIPKEWLEQGNYPYDVPGFWSITAYSRATGELPETSGGNFPTVYAPNSELVTIQNGNAEVILSKLPLPVPLGYNWLPLSTDTSDSGFYLIMRVYGPQSKMYGSPSDPPQYPWSAPTVRRIGSYEELAQKHSAKSKKLQKVLA